MQTPCLERSSLCGSYVIAYKIEVGSRPASFAYLCERIRTNANQRLDGRIPSSCIRRYTWLREIPRIAAAA